MALYIDSDGNYPRYAGDIYSVDPSWQVGDPLPQGWLEVAEVERPASTETTYVYEDYPTQVAGVLSQNWVSRPYTTEELAAMSTRVAPVRPYIDPDLPSEIVEQLTGEPL